MARVSRRWFLTSAAAALFTELESDRARGDEPERPSVFDVRELRIDTDPGIAERALLLSPRDASPARRYPVLVLLHGLGETENETLGIHAWAGRYGLVSSDARLRSPPVSAPHPERYLPAARRDRIDRELASLPYRGFVVACPFTPNVYKAPSTHAALDRYSAWIEHGLLPAVHAGGVTRTDVSNTAIDGCSLGGYMAFEVFLRLPHLFGSVGGIQIAVSDRYAALYPDKFRAVLDRVGPRRIHVESSVWDPSKGAHELMSKGFRRRSVPHDFDVLPGGHDQIFLREIGTLEMLLWQDRGASR